MVKFQEQKYSTSENNRYPKRRPVPSAFRQCEAPPITKLTLELVQESLTESNPAHFSPFFTFFQLRSTGYAPSKTQKLTKNLPVFANGRES
jgi:hypothetical protein